MKNAIQKAIEGGFKHQPSKSYNYYLTMCNTLFWQCLGKSLRWKKWIKLGGMELDEPVSPKQQMFLRPAWLYHWHSFIDHLAEDKDPELFFNKLINKK